MSEAIGVFGIAAFLSLTAVSCGYHVGGKDTLMPKSIQTIAVPPFTSFVNQYNLSDQLANAIGREFSTRTRYRVVPSASDADAVLQGAIMRVNTYPVISDPSTGRATSVAVDVTVNITLTERANKKVLYSRPGMTLRSYYEIATDPHQTFDETGPAFHRITEAFAREIVSAVVENF